jgi:ATP-binding cassette subfamily C protein
MLSFFRVRLPKSPLTPLIESCRGIIGTLAVTSGMINVLMLTGSLFMMQVYDRVLGSQSVPTLIGLSVIAVAAYLFQGWLEAIRGRILTLVGETFDASLAPKVHEAGLKLSLATPTGHQDSIQVFRDLDAIRGFVTGPGLVAALDMPWVLLYLAVATLLHPWFGLTATIAAVLLVWLTWRTERASAPASRQAHETGVQRHVLAEANIRHAEAMRGNGMRANRIARWRQAHEDHLTAQRSATFVIGGYGAAAKSIRLLLQSFVLALGAWLAIKGQISAGAIIAASIVVSRALAPIDQAIAGWRPFQLAREGHARLDALLSRVPSDRDVFELDPPKSVLSVKDLAVVPPGSQTVSVAGVSFSLKAGQVLGVVGPSMSGKSSLVKALVGVWQPVRGQILFDGSGPEQWTEEALGAAMGYLPQDVQLFEGTIAENICRFAPDAASPKVQKKVLEAARAAGLDGLIRSAFPKTGYDHRVGPNGAGLAGGLKQRIGLARALYGEPFLVVLDEPNSNLDDEGEQALGRAMRSVKARGGIVICVSHRQAAVAEADLLLTMVRGAPDLFGPRDEVLSQLVARAAAHAATPSTLPPAPTNPVPARPAQSWSTMPVRLNWRAAERSR